MIKFGIIGMGIRGSMYSNFIFQSPYATLEAICEVNKNTLNKAIKKYNVTGYSNFKDMIDNCNLDAVIVTTPDFLHKDAVIYAASHKLHVMVEKPFSTSVKECEEMMEVVNKNNVKCMVAFENRWSIPFISAKNAIDSGEIGNIIAVNARLNNSIYVPTKMLSWAKDTSPAWFLFPHIIDMTSWLTGKRVDKVYAVGVKKKLKSMGLDTYDSIQATVSFDNGTNATFTTCWVLPESMPSLSDQKFEIIGEKNSLYLDLFNQMVTSIGSSYLYPRILGTSINGKLASPPCYMTEHFIDCIRDDRKPIAGPEDGLLNTKIIEAIHESIQKGEIIGL